MKKYIFGFTLIFAAMSSATHASAVSTAPAWVQYELSQGKFAGEGLSQHDRDTIHQFK